MSQSLLLLLLGCPHRTPPPLDPRCAAPLGTPEQVTTPAGAVDRYGFAITVGPLERCGPAGTIAIAGSGHRRFVLPPEQPTCEGRPDPADPCETVRPDWFGADVIERLQPADVVVLGDGMGPCGTLGPLEAWDFGISLDDWADADAAIEVAAERLRAWRMGDTFHVSVEPLTCTTVLQ